MGIYNNYGVMKQVKGIRLKRTYMIPQDLERKMKHLAADQGTRTNDVIVKALEQYLEQSSRKVLNNA